MTVREYNQDFLPRIDRAREFVSLFESGIEHMDDARVDKSEVRKQFKIRCWSEETKQTILTALGYYKKHEGLDKLEREEKDKLLKYLDAPIETSARNRMGCSENWYDPYYAMKETFSREQIEGMTDAEIKNLLALAQNISEGLY